MKTITGNMLNGIERDLLRIAQELAVIHGQITAAKFVAVGVMSSTEDQPWFSRDEHYEPLVKASEQMIAARNATLQAVREVQGTNPIPARACTSLQHEGYPTRDDSICTECSGTGYVAGIEDEEQDWGSPVGFRTVT